MLPAGIALVLGRLNAVQAVRGILAREKYHVPLWRGFAGVDGVGRNIKDCARLGVERFAVNLPAEVAFEDIDPLLVGVRMRLGAGAGLPAHQADDDAVALDAGSVRSRVGGPAHDLRDGAQIEEELARTGAGGAWRTCGRLIGHGPYSRERRNL